MILTKTYKEQIESKRDLLAAFSSLDHGSTGDLSEDQINEAVVRLLMRLAALTSLHGLNVPSRFLEDVRRCGESDIVSITSSYLESGSYVAGAVQDMSELQQEIVHFSRIVDVDPIGLDGDEARAVRRLRKSINVPDSLKVLSELFIVARARVIQRGGSVPSPVLRPSGVRSDIGEAVLVQAAVESTDFGIKITSSRRRLRRQAAYYFDALLSWLTPAEASLAISVYLAEAAGKHAFEIDAAWMHGQTMVGLLSSHSDPEAEYDTPFDAAMAAFPRLQSVAATPEFAIEASQRAVQAGALTVLTRVDGPAINFETGVDGGSLTVALSPLAYAPTPDPNSLALTAVGLLSQIGCGPVRSIECGHVHLDRDLDIDQEVGARIGKEVYGYLRAQGGPPPMMAPMVDDDHVLVKLRPSEFTDFMRKRLGTENEFHLILESNPIVRAIVVTLFDQLRTNSPQRLAYRGGNTYVRLNDGTHCELFEGWEGSIANGCVLFETALLVYRTDVARFDEHVRRRLGFNEDIQNKAANILDSDLAHDQKVAEIRSLYMPLDPLTNPRSPDLEFSCLVHEILSTVEPQVVHLNVLEDYYEVQQNKVRKLLALIGIPIRLISIHFNATTGRISIDG